MVSGPYGSEILSESVEVELQALMPPALGGSHIAEGEDCDASSVCVVY